MSASQHGAAEEVLEQPRRKSIFDRFKKEKHHDVTTSDAASTLSGDTLTPDSALPTGRKKEKRESISDRGAFRIEMRNGVPIAVENTDWPPGVSYTKTAVQKRLESANHDDGDFYANQGAIVPGGMTAGNIGPDPDWVPGLTKEQREALSKDKKGNYVF